MTYIEGQAFQNCSSLKTITIGSGTSRISLYAFANCPQLTDVYCFAKNVPILKTHDGTAVGGSQVFVGSNIQYATLYVPKTSISLYKQQYPWNGFMSIEEIIMPEYTLTYMVDGMEYKTCKVEQDCTITPEPIPTKEGYTFSGWNGLPGEMPDHDVTVTGTFTINHYNLNYIIDDTEYKSYNLEYGATITKEADPEREGYTFSGWSEIPATMPAQDVTITGTFTANKYKLTYIVGGNEFKTYEVEYGTSIIQEASPEQEGYTFSGWSEIPEIMPAHDVTVIGSFIVNTYTITYMIDDEVYKNIEFVYGAAITPEDEPTKEGYTFSGWSDVPETMPSYDVKVNGTFTVNTYTITYLLDGEIYKSYKIDYGTTITQEEEPVMEGYTFSGWSNIPETMPAKDISVTGYFNINKYMLTYTIDGEEYKSFEIEYGTSLVAEAEPEKEGYTFMGWSEIPETMPAHDVIVTGRFERHFDVGNVASVIDFILNENFDEEDLELYDMNSDGELNIGDLILIVRKVLDSASKTMTSRTDVECIMPDLALYTAAQFVVNVPQNVREQDIRLTRAVAKTHQMMCKQIEPGKYAVVVYSLMNSKFAAEGSGFIEVETEDSQPDGVDVQNVVLAKHTGESAWFGKLAVATAIADVERDETHGTVYDLKGRKQEKASQKGVYIKNGKKIVVK